MNFKPSDFYLGVVEVFGVLLPGILLAALLSGPYSDEVFGPLISHAPRTTSALLAVYLVSGYLLGNALRAAGEILDLSLYDKWYLKRRQKNGDPLQAKAARLVRKQAPDLAIESVSTHEWAESFLAVRSAEATQFVAQGRAESKFYRSLALVLLYAGVVSASQRAGAGIVLLLAAGLSVMRYLQMRWRATCHLYLAYIHICADDVPTTPPARA